MGMEKKSHPNGDRAGASPLQGKAPLQSSQDAAWGEHD